jgi:hypothetical protein
MARPLWPDLQSSVDKTYTVKNCYQRFVVQRVAQSKKKFDLSNNPSFCEQLNSL